MKQKQKLYYGLILKILGHMYSITYIISQIFHKRVSPLVLAVLDWRAGKVWLVRSSLGFWIYLLSTYCCCQTMEFWSMLELSNCGGHALKQVLHLPEALQQSRDQILVDICNYNSKYFFRKFQVIFFLQLHNKKILCITCFSIILSFWS